MHLYNLTVPAEEDLFDIWSYTDEQWSTKQADNYIHQLHGCFARIAQGQAAVRSLAEIHVLLETSLCQRHRIFYLRSEKPVIIAVLHQHTDFISRLVKRLEAGG